MTLEIFIPSRSRWVSSKTLDALHGRARWYTLVVPTKQVSEYRAIAKRKGAALLACPLDGIARTRQFIGQQAKDKFIMLDDDLRFFHRNFNDDDDTRLYPFADEKKNNMADLLRLVESSLDKFVHVAISARAGNNNMDMPYELNSRPLRALAYRREAFLSCKHGRVDIMEDFDVTLQLLKRGYRNMVITKYAQDHIITQVEGGCSDYRTHALHAKSVKELARLHAPFVKLRVKENRSDIAKRTGFERRLEATIQWERAWRSSYEELL